MYAIVDIAGQQFKVEKDKKIFVHRLDAEEGSTIDFDKILLIDDGGKVQVGTPIIKDMIVTASIVSHVRGDKVQVFKKKRRKSYQKLNGHRQNFTEILIESIGAGTARPKPTPAKEKKVKTEGTEVAESAKVEKKATAVKKAPAKKAAVKTADKKPAAKAKPKQASKPAAKAPAKKKPAKKAAPKKSKE